MIGWAAAYAIVREHLPGDVRIRTESASATYLLEFGATDGVSYVGGMLTEQGAITIARRGLLASDRASFDFAPTFGVSVDAVTRLARLMAHQWARQVEARPVRLIMPPERGKVLVGRRGDDLRMIEKAAHAARLPYMLSPYVPERQLMILDMDALGMIPPPDLDDRPGLFGTTGLLRNSGPFRLPPSPHSVLKLNGLT